MGRGGSRPGWAELELWYRADLGCAQHQQSLCLVRLTCQSHFRHRLCCHFVFVCQPETLFVFVVVSLDQTPCLGNTSVFVRFVSFSGQMAIFYGKEDFQVSIELI